MIKTVLVTLAVVGFGTCYPTTTKKPFVDEYLRKLQNIIICELSKVMCNY